MSNKHADFLNEQADLLTEIDGSSSETVGLRDAAAHIRLLELFVSDRNDTIAALRQQLEEAQGQLRVTSVGAVKAEEMLMDSLDVIEGTDAEVFRQRDEIAALRQQLAEREAEVERLQAALSRAGAGDAELVSFMVDQMRQWIWKDTVADTSGMLAELEKRSDEDFLAAFLAEQQKEPRE